MQSPVSRRRPRHVVLADSIRGASTSILVTCAAAIALLSGDVAHAQPSTRQGPAAADGHAAPTVRSDPDPARTIRVAPGGPATALPRKAALVIGNSAYRSIPTLPNARHDAADFCTALRGLGYDTTCAIDVGTRRELRELVRRFATSLNRSSAAIVYYAGHGVQLNGENFLIPTHAEIRALPDIEDEGLSLNYVLRSLETARSAPNVIVLDACRDNPFAQPTDRRGPAGLARVDPPPGTVLAYATAPDRVAIDGRGRNGLFTKHLLAHITQPALKLDELFQLVARGVEEEARSAYGAEQVPYRSSSFSGVYCLAGCDNPAAAQRLEQIQRESTEANRRIRALQEENARLRNAAEQGASTISALEERIAKLSVTAGQEGRQRSEVEAELARLRGELARAMVARRDAEQLEARNRDREREIDELRGRVTALQKQALEIEDYRRQVQELQQRQLELERSRAADVRGAEPRPPRGGPIVPSF